MQTCGRHTQKEIMRSGMTRPSSLLLFVEPMPHDSASCYPCYLWHTINFIKRRGTLKSPGTLAQEMSATTVYSEKVEHPMKCLGDRSDQWEIPVFHGKKNTQNGGCLWENHRKVMGKSIRNGDLTGLSWGGLMEGSWNIHRKLVMTPFGND